MKLLVVFLQIGDRCLCSFLRSCCLNEGRPFWHYFHVPKMKEKCQSCHDRVAFGNTVITWSPLINQYLALPCCCDSAAVAAAVQLTLTLLCLCFCSDSVCSIDRRVSACHATPLLFLEEEEGGAEYATVHLRFIHSTSKCVQHNLST